MAYKLNSYCKTFGSDARLSDSVRAVMHNTLGASSYQACHQGNADSRHVDGLDKDNQSSDTPRVLIRLLDGQARFNLSL